MRVLVAGVLALTVSVVLAGCSGGGSAGPPASPPADAPVTSSASAPPTSPSTGGSGASGGDSADWPMYHRDPTHSGYAASMPTATKARLLTNLKLDGEVYASPIVVDGRTIIATENDIVYGLDARYRQQWKVDLGNPSPGEERQCGDITPLGITGTPIYDAGTDSVYLVAEQAGNVRHELYALDPATGKARWSRTVDLPGVSARDMQQRGALAIAHGKVWVSFGAQAGDCGDYEGRVVGVDLDGKGTAVYYSPPTERGGGIWNPAGPTLGPDGDILAVSANGAAFPGDTYDYTNTVLRIDGDAKRVDSFAPSDWAQNNQGDVGLGSQSLALVGTTSTGDPKWAVLGGKSGPVYVLRPDDLGGIGGEVSQQDICPSYGGAAVLGDTAFLPCTDGVRAVRVDDAGTLHVRWHADDAIQGSPVIGGDRVWTLDASGGVLHAFDPSSGASMATVDVGETSRFATPAISGRDVLVPTLTGLAVVRTSS